MKKVVYMSFLVLGILAFAGAVCIGGYNIYKTWNTSNPDSTFSQDPGLTDIQAFSSSDELKQYLAQARNEQNFSGMEMGNGSGPGRGAVPEAADMDSGVAQEDASWNIPDRISTTNVQVSGIDEPDILKTDGENIFLSNENVWLYRGVVPAVDIEVDMEISEETARSEEVAPAWPSDEMSVVQVLNAFPPEDLSKVSEIKDSGNLLLIDSLLIVFRYKGITAYDVSDPSAPQEAWNLDYSSNTSLISARYDSQNLYVATATGTYAENLCPLEPFADTSTADIAVACTSIYHPQTVVAVDQIYTVLDLDPETGEANDSVSFLGSSSVSVFYMSPENIYVTYSHYGNVADLMIDFFIENEDLFSAQFIVGLKELKDYDLSYSTKMSELQIRLSQWELGLDDDEKVEMETELINGQTTYAKEHLRNGEQTGIVRISLPTLDIDAAGQVPGHPLNQFSLDEYEGHLRIATTISDAFGMTAPSGVQSMNDVYVLDSDLTVTGAVLNLGEDETIYSVRFIEDKGYVVTFKIVDPFFVVDLSDPDNPELSGELKIPGYSSYLHPLGEDLILGVGQQDSQVKLSLFDVSVPNNPVELDTFLLNEYWSTVSKTHHAFLLDPEHEVFFIPGMDSAYVISYEGRSLSLAKAVGNISAQRALYLDNYLYLIGFDKIIVLDEENWERANELSL
ncbi:MAG: beta-propeller domain-containing protein [Candidatus Dojkabacteria bacterium]|nr:beta-propeller domain-containing protein [Candidatus Dojkabacteria bacterium]